MAKEPADAEKPDEPTIEVQPENEQEPTVEVPTEEKNEESKYVTREELDKFNKQNQYFNRKMDRTLKKLDQMAQRAGMQQQPQVQMPQYQDPSQLSSEQIDQIAQSDWQKAVDIKAQLQARAVLEQERAQQYQQQKQQYTNQKLDHSKQVVRQRYPDIDDETSETAQMYMQILNSDQSLLSNINGPEIAMYRMEEQMRQQGKTPAPIQQQVEQAVDSEVARRERIGAAQYPQGRSPGQSNSVTLTQSEVDFADTNHIPRNEFAKMKKLTARDFKEGVSVDE